MIGSELMRYRLTARGKIVAVVFAILLAVSGGSMLFDQQPDGDADSEQATASATDAEESVSEQKENVGSNEVISEGSEEPGNEDASGEKEDLETSTEEDKEKVSALKEASSRVYFKPDKYELTEDEAVKLHTIIEVSKMYPENEVVIEGNINGYPQYDDSDFGITLSEKRAEVVKAYLIDQGMEKSQIMIFSMGSQKPIENTNNLTDCWKNRRTDVYFKDFNGLEY